MKTLMVIGITVVSIALMIGNYVIVDGVVKFCKDAKK